MTQSRQTTAFLLSILFCVLIAGVIAYYRYIVLQDFLYFTEQNPVPDRFSTDAYKQL